MDELPTDVNPAWPSMFLREGYAMLSNPVILVQPSATAVS